jgi:A/G-specific adenine glycosylase
MWAWAEELKDREHPREGNSALMELGQRVCTPRRPDCEACPVREFCVSAGPEAELRPRRRARREVVAVTEHALFAVRGGRILLARETGSRRRGLWRLPLRSEEAVTDPPLALLSRTNCAVTHYRIRYCVYDAPGAEAEAGEEWVALGEAAELAMPGPVRRVVDGLLAAGELG